MPLTKSYRRLTRVCVQRKTTCTCRVAVTNVATDCAYLHTLPDKSLSGLVQVQPSSVTSSSTRSEAPSQYSVTDAPHQPERLLEPRRSFTVQAAMQEVAQPDAMSQPVYTDSNQGTYC